MKFGFIWKSFAPPMVLAVFLPCAGWCASETVIREVTFSANSAFERGLGSTTVQHDPASQGMVLKDSYLVEDDGQGSGGVSRWAAEVDRSPIIQVDSGTWVKKILEVDRPDASEAVLYVRAGTAALFFNGTRMETRPAQKFVPVPAGLIKRGRNEVEIRGDSSAAVSLKISARKDILENDPTAKDRPARSFKSRDGGKTWEPIDGELTVRLHLTQYPRQGSFTSPIIDLARDETDELGLKAVTVQSVEISAQAQTPAGTKVDFAVRFGSSPVYDVKHWGDWQSVPVSVPTRQRFVQWQAMLASEDPRNTPMLQQITLRAGVKTEAVPDSARGWTVKASHNEEILQTSMPFEYEDPNQPRMKALREKYRLDEIVRNGRTELEKLVMLRNWVAHQWKYHPPEDHFPAWDADEILTRREGMCVQYAITYIQCCNALGYPGRYVCGEHPGTVKTAHEVTEIWCNEQDKWICMDPTDNHNEFYADPKTGQPLSMLEVHDRMVKHYYGDQRAIFENRPKVPSLSGDLAEVHGLDIMPVPETGKGELKEWPAWTKWLFLCYVPRNNFYAKPNPLPRLQGWNDWDWTGFWSWTDAQTPRDWRYRDVTCRRADLEWTLNQVRFSAAYGEKPMTLAMNLGTVTPNFDTYLMKADGQEWKPVGSEFAWIMHPGANRLEMRVRNTSGVLGPVSFLALDCASLN